MIAFFCAIVAAVLLLLVALGVEADAVDLFVLALMFWVLYFAFSAWPFRPITRP
jgi:asparagine N-glycosylation enzyme membrane subunit Stt3